jgi:hypothetical protein
MHDISELIGQQVTAVGSCGQGKGKTVTGTLSYDDQWLVTVIEDGFPMIYSVYITTIQFADV